MKTSKLLLVPFLVVIFLISLNVNTANASEQICIELLHEQNMTGLPIFLTLGVSDFGNYHFALVGTDADVDYDMPGIITREGLVHGNADIVNSHIEISLNGSMSSGDTVTYAYVYHLSLDPDTLTGSWVSSQDGFIVAKGPIAVRPCPVQ